MGGLGSRSTTCALLHRVRLRIQKMDKKMAVIGTTPPTAPLTAGPIAGLAIGKMVDGAVK